MPSSFLIGGGKVKRLFEDCEQVERNYFKETGLFPETAALKTMLPWLPSHVEQVGRAMGGDYWPYGSAKHEANLRIFPRYHFEQGLSRRQLEPQELFTPEAMEAFKI